MAQTIIKYIARFLLRAETPLFVGSGNSTLLKDALVQKDANGFPMIPGTSLAGVLRHSFAKLPENSMLAAIFGDSKGGDTGTGSLLKVSPALMMLDNSTTSEGLILDQKWNNLKEQFDHLPVRQHVRMNDKGVAEKNGLFDNEVIFKGTRFVFELELTDLSGNFQQDWQELIDIIQSPEFRIGAGTRNGYGCLKVQKIQHRRFDLRNELTAFLNFSPSFNDIDWTKEESTDSVEHPNRKSKIHYTLKLTPDPFFIFGSGSGDEDVDNTPLEEEVITYTSDGIKFQKQTVIPGSSIKGALAHRVAYHFNKRNQRWAGTMGPKIGVENEAVAELFGKAGKSVPDPAAGKVFINDIFLSSDKVKNDKILNHVAIDRFTGGALEGALFSEKVSYLEKDVLGIDVFLEENVASNYAEVLEEALLDICKGLLPLGGMTTKGHGIFTGSLIKNQQEIFSY
ncbi:CRISPR/Cas system CSM-associated protein Csm3, group 7 of RAMP superfamily [Algoriphagus alkaliphilus]|uniref:CRISPR/Cas system CSM-associated protein Csm3, group 7 of RAMP superfamily n=1 Tax=Algoriphagus alkaliphilus TaxID=279824 RepID=A0A1G5X2P1_9BACT|nr:RAMP superfamily CRISPR-associated protein [Algoriphagus alkaliphilus]SDA64334.1 CRISPR/Cas system CSM-associated protein Csm3, group 7 of RAMP superfamily [Algoriphagus alkaliphilus]